ncbi:hypothetical protein DL766_000414 [Monosporascus sp. MC13-8B]|uniref:Partial AB-hydrolase lipase domain-containing protein n=1 Tax=Monosporascus cannonballus TaxID=155416 RepID=A0ABY0GYK7_9PEZI|nr:hypothetical protein DL762_007794 [Monosporascus cannonballus]RYO99013.1 hypothetical protein DL763_001818 [Monosporascus cannonballus]RYP39389.1 hypothetical protein DL766_000414 [Monosporascus sp. MC13-8B]
MPVPFVGRLNLPEYFALIGSFFFVALESVIRVLTLALPSSILSLFQQASQRLFNKYASSAQKRAQHTKKAIHASIRDASDFVDLCALYGYTAEEHVVQTQDGYLLGVHRLAWRKGEEETRVNAGPGSVQKRVIYLHHGLLMNSEVWVCLTDAQRCLPFVLVERGFDVWKSIRYSPNAADFWDFSIDEFAFYDIPDTITYILELTKQPSLSYIGFSQGTAQSFASLAVHPKLNDQVNVFIALAPAMSPAGLSNGIVDALVKASPQVLFLMFGRRSILSSATMWQSLLYPPIFVRLIDMSLSFLFGWRAKNISLSQKFAAYPHLYSFTSTKSVVHWFQIIRNKSFQMYDDDVQTHLAFSTGNKFTKVARYPTRNIKTPIVLVYGGSDSLVDIKVMLKELPSQTVATEIPHYEHLDFLWARDIDAQVFQHVFDALDSFTHATHSKEEYAHYRQARHLSLSASSALKYDGRESDSASTSGFENGTGGLLSTQHRARENSVERPFTPPSDRTSRSPDPKAGPTISPIDENGPLTPEPPKSAPPASFDRGTDSPAPQTPSPSAPGYFRRRATSSFSIESLRDGRGIKIAAAKPVGSVVTNASPSNMAATSSSDEASKGSSRLSRGR